MESPQLNLGLIGAGQWGRVYINAIKEMDGIRLGRLCSANPDSASLVDAGCDITTDWRAVAEATDLDGVIIATPPHLHCEITKAAIEAGNPVLVEKPLTTDLGEAEEVLAFAEKKAARAPTIVHVDHTHLYHPAYRELKRLGMGMGPIHAIRSGAGKQGPFAGETPVLWDWGAHDVAMCLDIMGATPETISCQHKERRETPNGIGETISIRLAFDGGVMADIEVSNLLERKKRFFAVHFDHETLIYDGVGTDALTLETHPDDAKCSTAIAVDETRPLTCAINAFAEAIRNGETSLDDLRLGVNVVRTLAACEKQFL